MVLSRWDGFYSILESVGVGFKNHLDNYKKQCYVDEMAGIQTLTLCDGGCLDPQSPHTPGGYSSCSITPVVIRQRQSVVVLIRMALIDSYLHAQFPVDKLFGKG